MFRQITTYRTHIELLFDEAFEDMALIETAKSLRRRPGLGV